MYLTKNDDETLERMQEAKSGMIGEPSKHDKNYKGPGMAEIKSSFKPYPYARRAHTGTAKTGKPT